MKWAWARTWPKRLTAMWQACAYGIAPNRCIVGSGSGTRVQSNVIRSRPSRSSERSALATNHVDDRKLYDNAGNTPVLLDEGGVGGERARPDVARRV